MTLQTCVSCCAHASQQWSVVRQIPSCRTGRLNKARVASGARAVPRCSDTPDADEPPLEDDGRNEFDPTPLESWILDDFDWDIEQAYPERGDYWDDSLDGEWDRAGCAAMTNVEAPMTKQARMTNAEVRMANEMPMTNGEVAARAKNVNHEA